jgi:hypothetical protein
MLISLRVGLITAKMFRGQRSDTFTIIEESILFIGSM